MFLYNNIFIKYIHLSVLLVLLINYLYIYLCNILNNNVHSQISNILIFFNNFLF